MKIPVNLTIQQLKNIVREAEANMEKHAIVDDIITLNVEPNQLTVTQPVSEQLGVWNQKVIFDKPINTSYSR